MPVQHYVMTTDGYWTADHHERLSSRDALTLGTYRPSASTTGVLPGSELALHEGDYITTADNEVIDSLRITGQLQLKHGGCVVTNCLIEGGVPDPYPAAFPLVAALVAVTPVNSMYDCTLSASSLEVDSSNGIQCKDINLYRCEITGTVDGMGIHERNVGLYGCWIHDLPWYAYDPWQTDGSHNDGVQIHFGTNYTLRGNSIEMGANATTCVGIFAGVGPISNVTLDKNWLISTGDAVVGLNIAEKTNGTMTGMVITDNRFSDPSTWRYGIAGLVDAGTYDAATISGNVYDSDGVTPANIVRVT